MTFKDEKLAQRIATLGVKHPAVLNAMALVPRAQFVGAHQEDYAELDEALPIACGQTISQPSLVARMTELMLGDRPKIHRVLEVGTGSGYQAAILSQVADEVYTIERYKTLYKTARLRFKSLGFNNIKTRHGDGYLGWSKHAPYDGIMVTAAAPSVPEALLEQLSEAGGRLVIPIGQPLMWQQLELITRREDQYETERCDAVVFVPMLPGRAEE